MERLSTDIVLLADNEPGLKVAAVYRTKAGKCSEAQVRQFVSVTAEKLILRENACNLYI